MRRIITAIRGFRNSKRFEDVAWMICCMAMIAWIPAMIFLDEPEEYSHALKGYVTEGTIEIIPEVYESDEEPVEAMELTPEEQYLLARIAMAEAESEDTEGKALVVNVVMNRVQDEEFPETVREVIFEEQDGVHQFSPLGDGRWERVEPDEDCFRAVEIVMGGWDCSRGALYFELTGDEETWHSRNLTKLFEHGKVSFYG